MAIPVRGSGQRFAEGSSVVANKDDRLPSATRREAWSALPVTFAPSEPNG